MKIFKKSLAMILSLIMVFSIIPASVFMASAASTSPIEGATGAGTEADPVIVDTRDELQAALLHEDELYILVNDGIVIDTELHQYSLDGDNRNIKHLTINGSLLYQAGDEYIGSQLLLVATHATLYLEGTGSIVSTHRCLTIAQDAYVSIRGELSFMSVESTIDCSGNSALYIWGGSYKNTSGGYSIEISDDPYVCIDSGEFLSGVDSGCVLNDKEKYICLYADGTATADTASIKKGIPFSIYVFGFETKTKYIPEVHKQGYGGTTYTYAKGEMEIPLGYKINELPQSAIDNGYRVSSTLTVFRGFEETVINEKIGSEYKEFYIDNNVVGNYTIRVEMYLNTGTGNLITSKNGTQYVEIKDNVFHVSGKINGVEDTDSITVTLSSTTSTWSKSVKMNSDFTYLFYGIEPGEYTLSATSGNYFKVSKPITVIDSDVEEDLNMTSNKLSISGKISGLENNVNAKVSLYRFYDDEFVFKESVDVNADGTYAFNNLDAGKTYRIKATADGYKEYMAGFGLDAESVVHNFSMEKLYSLTIKIKDCLTVNDMTTYALCKKGVTDPIRTGKIGFNGSITIDNLEKGDYYILTNTSGYESITHNFTLNSDKTIELSLHYEIKDTDYGFESQYPAVSMEDKSYGRTDLGVVFEPPVFSFKKKDIRITLEVAGYETSVQTKVWHNETAYEVIDGTYWKCGVYDYGTKKIDQIVTLYYPDGTVAGTKTHTYTYTYLPLKFNTHTPSVSAEEATAGVSNLGTLTKAQTFNFSAIPLDFTLTEEGYFLKLKTEAYQGDKLVYSAFSGDNYIHIYQGEGKVVQTIYMFDSNNTVVGSISHTYNFTMEFPDGTITLSSDYLTLTENSTYQLLATIVPEELASTLVWSSDNEDIATVSSNGTITAVRAGSAIIKAELGNGAVAYCPVMVTASDVKVYVGGVGIAEGEYLVQGSNVPRTTKPADNYAYLATVDGTLTLTLHNYSYSGSGTFTSKTAAYGIYSTSAIKIVAEGKNKIGPMSAPVERYTSYGIGGSESVSISSDSSSTLTIDGVSTGISSTRYVTVAGNLDIINASSGINATHGQSMGSITFSSGKVNIDCTGTAITITGNAINFAGAKVNIKCNNGINLVRQGSIYITKGSLAITASASGINLKSGQSMQVDGGSVFVDAVNHGIQLAGDLIVNGGTMAVKSSDTASDSSYAALYGSGTVSLGSSMSATASTEYAGSSTVSFNSADMNTYDYVLFSGTTHEFVRQPVGGTVAKDKLLNVKWEAGFTPLKIELVIYDTTEFRVVELNKLAKSTSLSALPDGGYYQLRAYYTSSYYVVSDRFYVTTKTHTVIFYTGSNVLKSQQVKDGETATTPGVMLANGKYFVGWATESGEMFSLSTPITSDISLYAVWSLVQVDGVAMGEGTYLAPGALSTTTERPEGGCAYYEDGVLMLYNYHSDSWGIYFGEMDLVIYSLGESNSVNCIVGYGADSSLTIDGNAKMNIGHAQWMDKAIVVGDTITFRTDTEVECVDAIAIYGAEKIIVDNCDVRVSAYMDMGYPAGIYGNEAAIYVLGSGSLYVRCDDYYVLTDAYIAEPDKVTVSANENRDGIFTADDIITDVDEPYDLENYNQMLITHKHSFNTVITVPTCQHSGIKEHYMCFCGKIYADAEGTQEITDYEAWKNGEGKLETLDHNWIKLDGECIYGCGTIAFEAANGAVLDKENRYIFGLDAGIKSLDNHTNVLVEGLEWTYELGQFGGFGTGTKAILVNDDDLVAEYTLLIYGDVDGDGWYDGEDAFLVNCIVAGMLTKDDLPDYMWMAADCNHDGVIDQKDADLLIGAGVRLNDIDQHADQTELSTQSAYMEYVALIDQSASIDVESDEDKNEQDKEDTEDVTIPDTNEDGVSDGTDESDGTTEKFDIVVVIMNIFDFIKNLLSWVFSFIIG